MALVTIRRVGAVPADWSYISRGADVKLADDRVIVPTPTRLKKNDGAGTFIETLFILHGVSAQLLAESDVVQDSVVLKGTWHLACSCVWRTSGLTEANQQLSGRAARL